MSVLHFCPLLLLLYTYLVAMADMFILPVWKYKVFSCQNFLKNVRREEMYTPPVFWVLKWSLRKAHWLWRGTISNWVENLKIQFSKKGSWGITATQVTTKPLSPQRRQALHSAVSASFKQSATRWVISKACVWCVFKARHYYLPT